MNAPSAFQLGWYSPVAGGDLAGATLPAGSVRTFTIPATILSDTNFVRIKPTWIPGIKNSYYFSMRRVMA